MISKHVHILWKFEISFFIFFIFFPCFLYFRILAPGNGMIVNVPPNFNQDLDPLIFFQIMEQIMEPKNVIETRPRFHSPPHSLLPTTSISMHPRNLDTSLLSGKVHVGLGFVFKFDSDFDHDFVRYFVIHVDLDFDVLSYFVVVEAQIRLGFVFNFDADMVRFRHPCRP